MEETSQFGRIDESRSRQQKIKDFFNRTLPLVWAQIPREERSGFIKSMAEDHLGTLLSDMNREERATLMNGLLPLIAHEFPLADLDLLSAFPIPHNGYGESQDESKIR